MTPISKKTLDGNVETFILSLLINGPNYGYSIVEDLKRQSNGLLELGEGTVYPVLYRMEKRELIDSSWETIKNGRKRKYYRITAKGRNALSENLSQWEQLVKIMENIREKTQLSKLQGEL